MKGDTINICRINSLHDYLFYCKIKCVNNIKKTVKLCLILNTKITIIILEVRNLNLINEFVEFSTEVISNGGFLFGILLIILESLIPMLPLCVFVALNINAFGLLNGIILSWTATCLGSYIAYLIFFHLSNDFIYKHIGKKLKQKVDKGRNAFRNISFTNLVLLVTLPFTPSFLINILAGVSGMNMKKFLTAIAMGKLFMIIFWGFVGKSFIESMTDLKTIIILLIMLSLAYILSKIVSKKTNIE